MKVIVTYVKEQEIEVNDFAKEPFEEYGKMVSAYDKDWNNPDPTESELYKKIERYCEEQVLKKGENGYIRSIEVYGNNSADDYDIYYD